MPSVLLVHHCTARQKSSVSPQSPVAPLHLQRCFLPVGHAAAAFAVPLAKLAGGQAEVLDHDACHVPQANPHPLAYHSEKMGLWDCRPYYGPPRC